MSTTNCTRVLLVDDNTDLITMLVQLLKGEKDLMSVGILESADDLLAAVAELRPDVVLLDRSMPGADPLDVLREVNLRFPDTRTLMFSAFDDRRTIDAVTAAGAWGIVSKDDEPATIFAAIRSVARGELCFPIARQRAGVLFNR